RYVIASPTFHRWHHTSEAHGLDKNFAGLLPIWDLAFGTFYMPAGELPCEFGIREAIPDTLLGQLAWPFRRDFEQVGDGTAHRTTVSTGASPPIKTGS